MPNRQSLFHHVLACGVLLVASGPASAATLSVRVADLAAPFGEVGCSLFDSAEGFPMDNRKARAQWVPATGATAECRFDDVPPGRYAVSIGHDRNGNRKVDTNFLGIPTEQWGASNNARPLMRAPRFEEALFTIEESDSDPVIDISVQP